MDHQTATSARAPRPKQPATHRSSRTPRLRNLVAVFATVALTFGGSVVLASTATAAPGDVTFEDPALAAAVNLKLGQNSGDPITEAQAASFESLVVGSSGIEKLGGIEYFTNLTQLGLSDNSIADLSPLSGMTHLTHLGLQDNNGISIADVSPLKDLTNLTSLTLSSAGITDISSLSNLTNLTHLNLSANSITSVSALSGMTDLTNLSLAGNSITSVSALSGMTDLTNLTLSNNGIADVSALSSMTNLTHLSLMNNSITSVSALSGMTNLTTLELRDNSITDLSALPSMTNPFYYLALSGQSVSLSSAAVGAHTPNPVADLNGVPIAVASSDSGFTYDAAANAWMFADTGAKTMTWSTPVTIGGKTEPFSGTITQDITDAPIVDDDVYPQDPEVVQATCVNGEVSDPQINLQVTDGVVYTIEGDVTPGATVTVRATRADDRFLRVDPGSDWVGDSDHMYATLEITLDTVDCDTPPTLIDAPNGDLPVNDPCGPDNATWILPTGADVSEGFTWRVAADGLLTAEASDGHQFTSPTGEMDPKLREYGYAPDTNEACPAATTPAADQPAAVNETLPSTGGPNPMAGIFAVALLAIGGIMLLAGRMRRKA